MTNIALNTRDQDGFGSGRYAARGRIYSMNWAIVKLFTTTRTTRYFAVQDITRRYETICAWGTEALAGATAVSVTIT
jgi:hypothetical protein